MSQKSRSDGILSLHRQVLFGAAPSFWALGGARAHLRGSLFEEGRTGSGLRHGSGIIALWPDFLATDIPCVTYWLCPWASSWISFCVRFFTGEMEVRIASFHKDAVRLKGL